MFLLKKEENRDFCLLLVQSALLISIFSAVLKGNANQPANFSGLILPEKWANLSQNVTVFGSRGWGLLFRNTSSTLFWRMFKVHFWDNYSKFYSFSSPDLQRVLPFAHHPGASHLFRRAALRLLQRVPAPLRRRHRIRTRPQPPPRSGHLQSSNQRLDKPSQCFRVFFFFFFE